MIASSINSSFRKFKAAKTLGGEKNLFSFKWSEECDRVHTQNDHSLCFKSHLICWKSHLLRDYAEKYKTMTY